MLRWQWKSRDLWMGGRALGQAEVWQPHWADPIACSSDMPTGLRRRLASTTLRLDGKRGFPALAVLTALMRRTGASTVSM